MSFLFTMIVLCTAIIGLFSQEFLHMFERLFKIPGMALIVPLLVGSFAIELTSIFGLWLLLNIRATLHGIENFLVGYMEHPAAAHVVVRILLLMLIALLPMALVMFLTRKKTFTHAMYYAQRVSAFIWTMCVILLVSLV